MFKRIALFGFAALVIVASTALIRQGHAGQVRPDMSGQHTALANAAATGVKPEPRSSNSLLACTHSSNGSQNLLAVLSGLSSVGTACSNSTMTDTNTSAQHL